MNAIYCRVSTDTQAEQGYSISDQIRSCHAHAAKLGLITTKESEYIDDGYSGEYLERPALDRLRCEIRAKRIKNVIIYDPDRLSRNLTNQLLIADEIEKQMQNCISLPVTTMPHLREDYFLAFAVPSRHLKKPRFANVR